MQPTVIIPCGWCYCTFRNTGEISPPKRSTHVASSTVEPPVNTTYDEFIVMICELRGATNARLCAFSQFHEVRPGFKVVPVAATVASAVMPAAFRKRGGRTGIASSKTTTNGKFCAYQRLSTTSVTSLWWFQHIAKLARVTTMIIPWLAPKTQKFSEVLEQRGNTPHQESTRRYSTVCNLAHRTNTASLPYRPVKKYITGLIRPMRQCHIAPFLQYRRDSRTGISAR